MWRLDREREGCKASHPADAVCRSFSEEFRTPMAHSLSAQKRVRQSEKRAARNRWRMTTLREAVKDFREKLLHGTVAERPSRSRR